MELEKFIKRLQNYKADPSDQLWEQIEQKLEVKKVGRSLRVFKIIAAASFAGLLGILSLYTSHLYIEHTPGHFASNEQYRSFVLEELDDASSYDESIYSIGQVQNLYDAYKQFSNNSLRVKK